MPTEGTYVFVCPSCGERIHVDEPMRETLIDIGCVVCGAVIDDADFSSA